MRYQITYLRNGERISSHVDADDAASAVYAINAIRDRTVEPVELISAVIDPVTTPDPDDTRHTAP